MCDRPAPESALYPRVEIVPISLVMFEASLSEQEEEYEHSGVYVSWRLTTLAKLSDDVSGVFSHELSRKAFNSLVRL